MILIVLAIAAMLVSAVMFVAAGASLTDRAEVPGAALISGVLFSTCAFVLLLNV